MDQSHYRKEHMVQKCSHNVSPLLLVLGTASSHSLVPKYQYISMIDKYPMQET